MMTGRCPQCGARLGRSGAACGSCGARTDAPALAIDVDDRDGARGAEVVFDRPRLGRGPATGAAAAVAAVALVIVVSVAVSTGGGDNEPRAAGTTVRATATTRAVRATSTNVWAQMATTVTRPSPPPSLAAESLDRARPIVIGAGPLLGERSGLVLFASVTGRLMRIDLDAAAVVDTGIATAESLAATSLGPVVQAGDGRLWLLARDGAFVPITERRGFFVGEGPPGRLWYYEYGDRTPFEPRLWSRNGADSPAIAFDLPADATGPVVVDGIGGVLVGGGGSIYRLLPSRAPERLGTGVVVDARDGRSLETACDERLRCGYVVRDLRTGEVRAAPESSGILLRTGGALLAPDGEWMLGVSIRGESSIDTLAAYGPANEVVALGETTSGGCLTRNCPARPAWASDGSWAFGVRYGGLELWAWHPGLTAPIVLRAPDDASIGLTVFDGGLAPIAWAS